MDQLNLFRDPTLPATDAPPLPDAGARARIRTDLGTSLLVEAGAGAGKTTEMVRRMVALVRSGAARVDEIAAVTFTRKAAAELREKFQTALERELREALASGGADTAAAQRLDAGLRQIDRAFLGTIHAFCARLLRERPLDAGLDPAFRETLGAEEVRLRRRFWHAHLERLAIDGDASLGVLHDLGLQPQQLFDLYEELAGQPDVDYVAEPAPRPDPTRIRRRVEGLMDAAVSHMPRDEPHGGWDRLQTSLRMLRFHRFVLGWSSDDAHFIDVLSALRPSSFTATKRRWADGDAARAIERDFAALFADDGPVAQLLHEWWAHRYPAALAFAGAAARAYEHERLASGTLNFQDLLMLAARLLRESPPARRELSERYRFLLVDEFQDTDPIQAEVLFLLASDEELYLFATADDDAAFASWRHLTPRPGALFVVGDPKQSIYRFRRADMMLYRQVRSRFESFGGIVELTANFRSRRPIETFVNETFGSRFPGEGTDEQAPFAPMCVQPRHDGDGAAGVWWYELDDPVHGRVPQLAQQDSGRVATWIAQRIESGERRAGDFLVLTPNTKWLGRYAAALEARNVPVRVTGAGMRGADNVELGELRLLLRSLLDPGDASLIVAVLVGLFFGHDYEQLTQHAEKWTARDGAPGRAPFSFSRDWPEPQTDVEAALAEMHAFWRLTRSEPADVAVPLIVEQLGVLPFAAAGELGESRAGALLFALDSIRAAALHGDASLAGALAALDAALDEDESEAPLEPGRADVVRVMNLHKAKGLESKVVILAMPFGDWSPEPKSRIVRHPTGRATGYATVTERRGPNQTVTLARPADWQHHAEEEERFIRAEDQRLLYVAATRAAEELVIGCAYNTNSPSPWRSFHAWLKQNAAQLELPQPCRGERTELQTRPDQVSTMIDDVAQRRALHARPTYRVAPVTERKRDVRINDRMAADDTGDGTAARSLGDPSVEPDASAPPEVPSSALPAASAGRGTDWGTAVHDALQLAAGGLRGEALVQACRSRLIALDRAVDATGTPLELDELVALVDSVLASPLWQRAANAADLLIEVPFAVALDAATYANILDLDPAEDAPAVELVEGRIDLVFRDAAGWVIVDYKSDAAGAAVPADLMRGYQAQLALYSAAWERIAGEAVVETNLLFTATGEMATTTQAVAASTAAGQIRRP
jgi:ATP-dependent helicase/nuclease subunit A